MLAVCLSLHVTASSVVNRSETNPIHWNGKRRPIKSSFPIPLQGVVGVEQDTMVTKERTC
jgi:hypothetical protein